MRRHIWNRQGQTGERGVALVEFAMVLPLLVLVCLGTVDFGRVYAIHNTVKNAAREGAAFAQLHPGQQKNTAGGICADPNNIEWHVHNESSTVNTYTMTVLNSSGTNITSTACNPGGTPASGTTIKVKASTTMTLVTPFLRNILGGSNPTISATVAVRVQ